MATNVYLTPSVASANTKLGQVAKYRDDVAAAGCTYGQMKYGAEPTFCLAAENVPAALHATIAADAACLACPPLENAVGAGAVAGVRTKLEGWNVPGTWVTAALAYREVCRVVCRIFEVAQRLEALGRTQLFGGAVTLDTTWGVLPAGVQADLRDVAASFQPPLDTSAVTNATTVRQLLKGLADQLKDEPVYLGPVTL